LSLIGRYIFREVFFSTLVVVAVLLVIFMSNQFAETLGEAAADSLPRDAVFTVLGLEFLRYLALLAPIGLLLGVLLGLARLNRDSELAALAACGAGPARLIRPVAVLSLLAACGVGWLSLVAAPAASRRIEEIRQQAQEQMELGAFVSDRFAVIDGGASVIYAREANGDRLEGVFIQRETEDGIVVIVAEQGERVANGGDGEVSLRLSNGRRYEGVVGEARFFIAEFEEQGMPLQLERKEPEAAIESRTTRDLFESPDPDARAELEWRIATPVSVFILSLLAVPLGRSSPREGKYARVGLGLLIYVIYANTLSIARVWMERDLVPQWLGTWWVHGLLAAVALFLLAQQSGIGAQAPRTKVVRHEPVS
jgi:lipopolysaccharide export system permease protein